VDAVNAFVTKEHRDNRRFLADCERYLGRSVTVLRDKKYGANRLLQGKLPLCAEMCSTKSLLAGDGDVIAKIYRERVVTRGYGSGAWGWMTAYRERVTT